MPSKKKEKQKSFLTACMMQAVSQINPLSQESLTFTPGKNGMSNAQPPNSHVANWALRQTVHDPKHKVEGQLWWVHSRSSSPEAPLSRCSRAALVLLGAPHSSCGNSCRYSKTVVIKGVVVPSLIVSAHKSTSSYL